MAVGWHTLHRAGERRHDRLSRVQGDRVPRTCGQIRAPVRFHIVYPRGACADKFSVSRDSIARAARRRGGRVGFP